MHKLLENMFADTWRAKGSRKFMHAYSFKENGEKRDFEEGFTSCKEIVQRKTSANTFQAPKDARAVFSCLAKNDNY